MARTTIADVKGVIATGLADADITLFINQANTIVTNKLGGEGLADSLLKDIETWMTAHLIAITKERQPEQEKVDVLSITYHKNPKGYFEQTTYGQTALMLDTSGKLQMAAKKRAWIRAIEQDSDDSNYNTDHLS